MSNRHFWYVHDSVPDWAYILAAYLVIIAVIVALVALRRGARWRRFVTLEFLEPPRELVPALTAVAMGGACLLLALMAALAGLYLTETYAAHGPGLDPRVLPFVLAVVLLPVGIRATGAGVELLREAAETWSGPSLWRVAAGVLLRVLAVVVAVFATFGAIVGYALSVIDRR
jgi:hypothetical protein